MSRVSRRGIGERGDNREPAHQCDAWLGVSAPENTRDGADISAERTSALDKAYDKAYRDARSRLDYVHTPSVMCWYPTPALAQDA